MTDQNPPQSATNTVINDEEIETNTTQTIENWDELEIDPSFLEVSCIRL